MVGGFFFGGERFIQCQVVSEERGKCDYAYSATFLRILRDTFTDYLTTHSV